MSDLDTTPQGRWHRGSAPRLIAMLALLAVVAAVTLTARGQDNGTPDNAATPSSQLQPPGGEAETGGPANASGPAEDPGLGGTPLYRLGELYGFAPIINGLIIGLSVIALMFFVWFMLTINSRAMAPPGLVDEVVKLVIRGDYERAADVCRGARGVFAADIVQRCVENANQQHSVVMDMIDVEGRRQADVIWNRISYLADISNVAPMLGLLGTVLGMIEVFGELQLTSGSITAQLLAGGVGKAMSTTMFGLAVGIFAVVLYSIVKSRATRTLADAEQAVHMIADHIKRDDTAIPSKRK